MELVVTPEQFTNGWAEFCEGVIIYRSFEELRRLPDGNHVVKVPEPTLCRLSRLPIIDAR